MTISEDDVASVIGEPIEKLDFSMWHPLDHQPWSPVCPTFYGSRRQHLSLWWEYQRPQPLQAIKCRLGRHDWTDYWRGGPEGHEPAGQMCRKCWLGYPSKH